MKEVSYLRRLRVLSGLSLASVSACVGISPSLLSMAERGFRVLPERVITKLASLYEVDSEVLALSGGHIPSWFRDKVMHSPVEAMQAAMDSFELYEQAIEGGN
jgi:transcriptional regulator with XRE-family HTH domain